MALSVSINLLLNSYTGCVIHHLKHDDEFFGVNLGRKMVFAHNLNTLLLT
ncbi:hypothetical protein F959_00354 [Acinetobacter venetianus RAG-1 = CIP 110063]|jgi:hypothetical protein|uniref:Uncharacterized protein n=1 Tax=Acinetobacter venetianus (strain ATCC 31012 / DSM 23050 / BCRC 14357 / CCUG 45561 / CIP 110063 / KCTC 2702 / LMG 19082 / RAG-1) TaxID=1191460 RepID=N8YP98_ACIVR|nr:hypothetical protein F959_00354 [Acinetobacter venetianus RAG-1 = CIP 110063]